jgi:hypothetical protein
MVKDVLVDVNNPSVPLKSGRRPSTAMLLELELGTHQQQILDQARQDTQHWKSEGKNSGSLRSATLHAHYSKGQKAPWFEVQLVIGIKPTQYLPPVNVVGVHIDPRAGWFVAVLGLDGTSVAQIHLDEQTIADWLQNDDPNQQAQILPRKRTPKEYHHRVANALIAICQYYQAQLGVENISYRHTAPEADPGIMNEEASRSIFALLNYKLARINLSKALDMRGVAPTRDCSHCGERSMTSHLERSRFHCSTCLHIEDRHINAAREVARRILWAFAQRKPRIYKGSKQKNETIA